MSRKYGGSVSKVFSRNLLWIFFPPSSTNLSELVHLVTHVGIDLLKDPHLHWFFGSLRATLSNPSKDWQSNDQAALPITELPAMSESSTCSRVFSMSQSFDDSEECFGRNQQGQQKESMSRRVESLKLLDKKCRWFPSSQVTHPK